MTDVNVFEVAVRNKLRFDFKGSQSVEDLWDLSVQDLDSIFKGLSAKLKQASEESLLVAGGKKTKDATETETKIEIIKRIVEVKLAEKAAKDRAKENKAKKDQLLAVLKRKQDQSVENMSEDDIKKLINEIDAD